LEEFFGMECNTMLRMHYTATQCFILAKVCSARWSGVPDSSEAEKSLFNGKSFPRNPLPTPLAENGVALGCINQNLTPPRLLARAAARYNFDEGRYTPRS
jgi:hypothetical protein